MLPILIFLVQSYSTKIEIQKRKPRNLKRNHDCDVFSLFRFCDVLCLSSNHEQEAIYSLCMGYSLCKMADFQSCLISRIFGVSSNGFFAQNNSNGLAECFFVIGIFNFLNNSNVLVEWFFACFWHF